MFFSDTLKFAVTCGLFGGESEHFLRSSPCCISTRPACVTFEKCVTFSECECASMDPLYHLFLVKKKKINCAESCVPAFYML